MSFPFNPHHGMILIGATLNGPRGTSWFRLMLDTGATRTVISLGMLIMAGYDPAAVPSQVSLTTASGVESVPEIRVARLAALGRVTTNLPILGPTLPPGIGADGVIGLDFLSGMTLTIDFRTGQITLV